MPRLFRVKSLNVLQLNNHSHKVGSDITIYWELPKNLELSAIRNEQIVRQLEETNQIDFKRLK